MHHESTRWILFIFPIKFFHHSFIKIIALTSSFFRWRRMTCFIFFKIWKYLKQALNYALHIVHIYNWIFTEYNNIYIFIVYHVCLNYVKNYIVTFLFFISINMSYHTSICSHILRVLTTIEFSFYGMQMWFTVYRCMMYSVMS